MSDTTGTWSCESHTDTPNQTSERVVLLVSCPVNSSVNKVLSTFGVNVDRRTPPMSAWQAGAPPRVADNLSFTRHMAVCLVLQELWTDKDLTYNEKLAHGTFWGHRGCPSTLNGLSDDDGGAGEVWATTDIESIEAIEMLGTTQLRDDDITAKCKSHSKSPAGSLSDSDVVFIALLHDWVYLPIWWNCQDFAIRLGYILAPTSRNCRTLSSMLRRLKLEMNRAILGRRESIFQGLSLPQWLGLHLTAGLVALTSAESAAAGATRVLLSAMGTCPPVTTTAVLAPPLVPAFGVAAAGCYVVSSAYRVVDWRRNAMWKSYVNELETRFSDLRSLHAGLGDLPIF